MSEFLNQIVASYQLTEEEKLELQQVVWRVGPRTNDHFVHCACVIPKIAQSLGRLHALLACYSIERQAAVAAAPNPFPRILTQRQAQLRASARSFATLYKSS